MFITFECSYTGRPVLINLNQVVQAEPCASDPTRLVVLTLTGNVSMTVRGNFDILAARMVREVR